MKISTKTSLLIGGLGSKMERKKKVNQRFQGKKIDVDESKTAFKIL